MPVIMNFSTGVFVFLPYPGSNLLKAVVHHGFGVANQVSFDNGSRLVSSTKLAGNNAYAGYIPGLLISIYGVTSSSLFLGLATALGGGAGCAGTPILRTETLSPTFIPICKGFSLQRAARAINAFKFTPVLGRYIADYFEHKASDELRKKWRLSAPDWKEGMPKQGDGSRRGQLWRLLHAHEQAKL
ncbi:hypothetical protein BDV30DRAFT_235639 [Aspergillus minisclerotigenes]|uniref:Uncharacterized protein n=1 Tax=Aspergillus minisclerotigenes TaxID=656917 RepID=A0A5N6JF47_9EURO|nr:hypothetical protein BDV30DRAFT_235639 [Aspergillus minisclerotigenes]